MAEQKQNSSFGTLVLVLILVPVILYLIHFSIQKNAEAQTRAQECQTKCMGEGARGHEFKWDVLSGPVCTCLGETK